MIITKFTLTFLALHFSSIYGMLAHSNYILYNVLRVSGAPNRTCRKPHSETTRTAREDIRRQTARRATAKRS